MRSGTIYGYYMTLCGLCTRLLGSLSNNGGELQNSSDGCANQLATVPFQIIYLAGNCYSLMWNEFKLHNATHMQSYHFGSTTVITSFDLSYQLYSYTNSIAFSLYTWCSLTWVICWVGSVPYLIATELEHMHIAVEHAQAQTIGWPSAVPHHTQPALWPISSKQVRLTGSASYTLHSIDLGFLTLCIYSKQCTNITLYYLVVATFMQLWCMGKQVLSQLASQLFRLAYSLWYPALLEGTLNS